MVPEAIAANETLFVSAENETFGNTFGGAQIVEVVVNNPDINRVDQSYGSPVVKVNGNNVLMAQGTDGAWYAYIADKTMVDNADGTGFEFDTSYTQAQSASIIGKALSGTQGFYASDALTATGLKVGTNDFDATGDIDNIGIGSSASWTSGNSIVIRGGTSGGYATATWTEAGASGFGVATELSNINHKSGTFVDNETLYLTQVATANVLGNVVNNPVKLNEVAGGNLLNGGAVDVGGVGLF
jgi:hypothetical protein